MISKNPYRLARGIRGIGFKSADQIAMRLGIARTAMIRVRAGIAFALAEAVDQGHCGLPTDELRSLATGLLEIPPELVDEALALELADGAVVADTVEGRACVFLAGLYRAEQGIAERLLRLQEGPLPWPAVNAEKAILWAEAQAGITPGREPMMGGALGAACQGAGDHGWAGVGKTTLVNTILQILKAKPPGRDDHAAVLRAFDTALQGKIGLNAPAYRSPHRPSLGS